MKIPYYQDPGHGWIKVTRTLVAQLGLIDKISAYSYENRETGFAYLEEDCDAGLLIDALRARGEVPVLVPHHRNTDSAIRRLPRFAA